VAPFYPDCLESSGVAAEAGRYLMKQAHAAADWQEEARTMAASGSVLAPSSRPKLREKAYESFTRSLLSSRIRPGQFLSQKELVAVIGLPLGAIRELIPRLEADKLIETVPQRGMQVASIDLKLVRNVFQLWIVLEKAAAIHFAELASDEDIQELADTYRDFQKRAGTTLDPSLVDEARRIEWTLHDRLIEFYGNELISDIYRVNRIKVELIRMERESGPSRAIFASLPAQGKIIKAIQERNSGRVATAVEACLEGHFRRAMGV
jgi:DNA-binding GntR family transcriptional regulator